MTIETRNPQYNAFGSIDCEVEHPEYGWIPFTASPDDPEQYGRDIYAELVQAGNVAPYVPPPEPDPAEVLEQWRATASCTRRQGRLALLGAGELDNVEAALDAIADDAQRRAARIEYEADTWERSNAFLQSMWAQLGGTPEELDALFQQAVTL